MTTPLPPRRIGQIIRLKPSQVVAYKELHANVWPEVLQQIHECNIRNCKPRTMNLAYNMNSGVETGHGKKGEGWLFFIC